MREYRTGDQEKEKVKRLAYLDKVCHAIYTQFNKVTTETGFVYFREIISRSYVEGDIRCIVTCTYEIMIPH